MEKDDLISRKALIEALVKSHAAHANNTREESLLNRDVRIVMEQPTAYNTEAVMEQLRVYANVEDGRADLYAREHFSSMVEKHNYGAHCYREATEVVRKGGVE